MKKIIVAALLVVGLTTFAQEKEGRRAAMENLTSEQKVDLQLKKLTKDLSLNEKQIEKVKVLVSKEVEKREAKRAEMLVLKTKKMEELRAQREELKAQREAEQAVVNVEMKKILTAEQYTKWEKNRDERKEHMKERMVERRENRKSIDPTQSK